MITPLVLSPPTNPEEEEVQKREVAAGSSRMFSNVLGLGSRHEQHRSDAATTASLHGILWPHCNSSRIFLLEKDLDGVTRDTNTSSVYMHTLQIREARNFVCICRMSQHAIARPFPRKRTRKSIRTCHRDPYISFLLHFLYSHFFSCSIRMI